MNLLKSRSANNGCVKEWKGKIPQVCVKDLKNREFGELFNDKLPKSTMRLHKLENYSKFLVGTCG